MDKTHAYSQAHACRRTRTRVNIVKWYFFNFETQFNLFFSPEDSDYFNFLLFISCIENFLNSQYFSSEKVFNTAQYTFQRFLRVHFINIEVRFFGQHRKTGSGNFQNWFLPALTVPFEKFRNQ